MTKGEKWYHDRLQKYFDKYYSEYDEVAEWYPNPAENKWKFVIADLGMIFTLTCNDFGQVIEKRERY